MWGRTCRSTSHPDKTFIGRTSRGFDFLGYHFLDGVLRAADKTVGKMTETAARLYEQKGRGTNPTPLGQYLTRWAAWLRGGLGDIILREPCLPAADHDAPTGTLSGLKVRQ